MSVSNGQIANETTFNTAFLSRIQDSSTIGIVGLLNEDGDSGTAVDNVQQELNSTASYTGKGINADKNVLPAWNNNDVGTPTDNLKARADALTEEFNPVTGHTHDGIDSPTVTASDIDTVRLRGYIVRGTNLSSVTGTTLDVSAQMVGKTASSGDTVKGVVTTTNNTVILRDNTSATLGDQLVDENGDVIFGRLTESSGVWTLSFYKTVGNVLTAHSFTSQALIWYYQELFNPITDAPVYNEAINIPSDNATQDVIDATASLRGLVSVVAQLFGGVKTFVAGIVTQAYFAMNRGDTASAASIAQLSSATSFRKLTGTTASTIHGIAAGVDGQVITIHNGSTLGATIKHESGSALSAADRFWLPSASDMSIDPDSSSSFIYDSGQSRWVLQSATGGGGSVSLPAPSLYGVVLSGAGSVMTATGPGTVGQVFTSGGPGAPGSFQDAAGGVGSNHTYTQQITFKYFHAYSASDYENRLEDGITGLPT